jgi:hypothetical protein
MVMSSYLGAGVSCTGGVATVAVADGVGVIGSLTSGAVTAGGTTACSTGGAGRAGARSTSLAVEARPETAGGFARSPRLAGCGCGAAPDVRPPVSGAGADVTSAAETRGAAADAAAREASSRLERDARYVPAPIDRTVTALATVRRIERDAIRLCGSKPCAVRHDFTPGGRVPETAGNSGDRVTGTGRGNVPRCGFWWLAPASSASR